MAAQPTLASALAATLLLAASVASAEPAGHYDPDKLPAASKVFVEVAKASGGAVDPLEGALVKADGALADLNLALALASGSVDEGKRGVWGARHDERSTRFDHEAESFQREVYALGDSFQRAFEEATARAVDAVEGEVVECREPQGSALGALAGRTEAAEPTCPGKNVTADIAAAWDADPVLAEAIAPLREPMKTTVTAYDEEAEVLGLSGHPAGSTWVSPQELAAAIPEAAEILDAIDTRAAEARGVLSAANKALDRDDPLAEDMVKAIRNRARGIRTWTGERRAALGVAVAEAIERNRKKAGKKAGWVDVGVCVNPEVWGGCAGTNVAEPVAEALLKDKKLAKALERMLIELTEPETSLD